MKFTNIIKTFQIYKNPLTFYSIYLKLNKNKLDILKLKNNLSFYIRPQKFDHCIVNEIYFQKDYHIAIKKLNNKSTVIDIGAHIGTFSLLAAKKVKKVYAYEPVKSNISLLKKNVKLNKIRNIIIRPIALSDKKGSITIYLEKSNDEASIFPNGFSKTNKKILTNTLSNEIKKNKIKNIDLIKIDCEGAEFPIFNNLKKSDFNKIKSIILEYHNYFGRKKTYKKDLEPILLKNNFKIKTLKKIKKNTGLIYAYK